MPSQLTHDVRRRLQSRERVLATFGIELAGTAVPEGLAQSGFDALMIVDVAIELSASRGGRNTEVGDS